MINQQISSFLTPVQPIVPMQAAAPMEFGQPIAPPAPPQQQKSGSMDMATMMNILKFFGGGG